MRSKPFAIVPTIATISLLVVGGCASKGDVNALRAEVAELRSSLARTEARAVRAEVTVEAAESRAAARARNASVDRNFRESLRK